MRRVRRCTSAAIVLAGCLLAATYAQAAQNVAEVGSMASEFSRKDLAGKEVDLAALRGKVILLNFWATWCSPCLSEIPRFAQWQQAYRARGLRIIGISMDDDEGSVREAYEKFKLNYPVVMGDMQLAEAYGGIYGLPLTLLIDRKGTVRFRQGGASNLNEIEHEIGALLSDTSPK